MCAYYVCVRVCAYVQVDCFMFPQRQNGQFDNKLTKSDCTQCPFLSSTAGTCTHIHYLCCIVIWCCVVILQVRKYGVLDVERVLRVLITI